MSEIRMITTPKDVDALPAGAKLEDPKTGLTWSSWRSFTPPHEGHRKTLIGKLPMIYKNHPDDQKSLYSVTEVERLRDTEKALGVTIRDLEDENAELNNELGTAVQVLKLERDAALAEVERLRGVVGTLNGMAEEEQKRSRVAEAERDRLAGVVAVVTAGGERDLVTLLTAQREWSEATFGPGDRLHGLLDHLRKELVEIEESPADVTEWLDVVILALDGAWRSGHTPDQIAAALNAKYEKNRNRKWPDWRTAEAGKAIEHDESDPMDRGCVTCGRDNRNGTHTALEQTGHLSHKWNPSLRAALAEGGA